MNTRDSTLRLKLFIRSELLGEIRTTRSRDGFLRKGGGYAASGVVGDTKCYLGDDYYAHGSKFRILRWS